MKVALVTGAGSGIGRAAALELARAGFAVALAGRRLAPLEETAALGEAGQTLKSIQADASDKASVDSLFAEIGKSFGRLDVLFNNAGISYPRVGFEDIDLAQWQSVIDVNVTGQFLCAQAAFRMMKEQRPHGGRIINNGSLAAQTPRPGSAPYSTSKHAVAGLTKTLLLDGRDHGIIASQIDIGNAAETSSRDGVQGMQANGKLASEPTVDFTTVAKTVCYMATLPAAANIPFLTIVATGMPYIGRG